MSGKKELYSGVGFMLMGSIGGIISTHTMSASTTEVVIGSLIVFVVGMILILKAGDIYER